MELSFFPRDVFAELDRLQRSMQQAFEFSPSIRGIARGGYPALNVGGTAQSVEVYAFAPGLEAGTIELKLEKVVPAKYRQHAHHWLILHGRYICKARKPDCWRCVVAEDCSFKPKTKAPDEK